MGPAKFRQNYLFLGRDLTVVGQFLPRAPAAESCHRARGIPPVRRGLAEFPDDAAAKKIPPIFLDPDANPFAG